MDIFILLKLNAYNCHFKYNSFSTKHKKGREYPDLSLFDSIH